MGESTNADTLKKYLIGIIITVLASSVFAATGWNFKQTSEIAEKYISKEEFKQFSKMNAEDHAAIRFTLDRIYEKLLDLHIHEDEE